MVFKRLSWLFLSFAAILFLTISCGDSATPTHVETPTPVPTSTPILPPTVTPTPQPTRTPTPAPTPITISAPALYSAYQVNEVGAKVKYEGKWASISGTVAIIEDAGGAYDVKLFGGALGAQTASAQFVSETIVCKVDKENVGPVVDLRRGDNVTILGIIEGMGFVDIEVTNCEIQP